MDHTSRLLQAQEDYKGILYDLEQLRSRAQKTRDAVIVEAYVEGKMASREIAPAVALSHQRVSQIVDDAGVARAPGRRTGA